MKRIPLLLLAASLLAFVPPGTSQASELVKLGRMLVTGKRAAPPPQSPATGVEEARPASPAAPAAKVETRPPSQDVAAEREPSLGATPSGERAAERAERGGDAPAPTANVKPPPANPQGLQGLQLSQGELRPLRRA